MSMGNGEWAMAIDNGLWCRQWGNEI